MPADRLLYRPQTGPKVRVTLDFVHQLFEGVAQELQSPSTQDFIGRTRIPNERELYGLLIKAMLKVGGDVDIGHVATEVQVDRLVSPETPDSKSTGRVDVLVTYRKTVFLIEVKVVRISLDTTGPNGPEHSKAVRAWDSAVSQLKAIDHKKLEAMLDRNVEKLALVIFLYYDGRPDIREGEWGKSIAYLHQEVCDVIDSDTSQVSDYEWRSTFEHPERPYRRKSTSYNSEERVNLYGFSLLAAKVG